MKMYLTLRFFSFIFFISAAYTKINATQINKEQRNLLILNSQNVERIGSSSQRLFASAFLTAALHQKSVPMLVSTCIWRNFLERKQEFSLRSQIPNTKEAKLKAHHEAILNKLNIWTDFFKKQTTNFSDIKLLVSDQITEEFCNENALTQLKDEKLLPQDNNEELYVNFNFYLFEFNEADWDVYQVTDFYYLFIPKNYIQKLAKKNNNQEVPLAGKDYEQLLGLSVNSLERVDDPCDSSLVSFEPTARPEGDFLTAIERIFISPFRSKAQYIWDIFLVGHGYNMEPIYPNNNEKFELIGNLSVSEFKKFLLFMNNKITMGVFGYSTCFGAGAHLDEPYCTDGKPDCFNFPIIINNSTDIPTYCTNSGFVLPIVEENKFNIDYYELDQLSNMWSLKLLLNINIKKFFSMINRIDKINEVEKLANNEIWRLISPQFIETEPNIRPINGTHFMIYQSSTVFKISPLLACLKQQLQLPIQITDHYNVLIESPVISVPLIIKSTNNTPYPRFISVLPGCASHYIEKIEAPQYYAIDLLKGFWPLSLSCFNKSYLINEFVLANDPDSVEAKILNAGDNAVTVYDMLVQIEGDSLVRIFFKNKEGAYFSAHGRYMQGHEEPSLNSLAVMSQKAVTKYKAFYDTTKKELLDAFEHNELHANIGKALNQMAVLTTTTAA